VRGPWRESIAYPITTLGKVCDVQLGKMLQPRPGSEADRLAPYLRAGSLATLSGAAVDLPEMYASAREISTYHVAEGDLVVAEGGDCGRTALLPSVPPNTIIQNSLHRLRPRADDVRFLRYALEAVYYSGWLDVLCNKATFGHLTREKLAALPIPNPAPTYQAVIADYLDRETTQVDALIAARRRMIAVLDERARAHLTSAVLGETASSAVKRSQVYGVIPITWGETSLRHLGCQVQTGPFGSQLHAEDYVDGGWPVVNPLNLAGGVITPSPAVTVSDETREELSRHVLRAGDIVFGRRGEMGRAGLVGDREAGWLCGTGCLRLRLSKEPRLSTNYLKLLLETTPARAYFELASVGSTMDNLNSDIVLGFPVPIPPKDSQDAIVASVLAMGHAVETARTAVELQIALLAERREALVTAAVTGELEIPVVAA
jgi:type I restriction enzyme S subunit